MCTGTASIAVHAELFDTACTWFDHLAGNAQTLSAMTLLPRHAFRSPAVVVPLVQGEQLCWTHARSIVRLRAAPPRARTAGNFVNAYAGLSPLGALHCWMRHGARSEGSGETNQRNEPAKLTGRGKLPAAHGKSTLDEEQAGHGVNQHLGLDALTNLVAYT